MRYNPFQIQLGAPTPRRRDAIRAPRTPNRQPVDAAAALERARNQTSLANYPAIVAGFVARGIPAEEIKPRENVFTFNAWKAMGRIVKRGEHGVKLRTMIPAGPEHETVDPESGQVTMVRRSRPWTTTVFHISQTEPIGGGVAEVKPLPVKFPPTPASVPVPLRNPVLPPNVVPMPEPPKRNWREIWAEKRQLTSSPTPVN